MKTFARIAAVASATLFFASAASATVYYDSEGNGWAGKGDVQLPFGWNNKQLQTNAAGVTFSYSAQDRYEVDCHWETTTGGPAPRIISHDVTVPRHVNVNSTVERETRNNSNGKDGAVTGFYLNGFGSVITQGAVPEVGGTCPGASSLATVVDVRFIGSEGGLSAHHGGISHLID